MNVNNTIEFNVTLKEEFFHDLGDPLEISQRIERALSGRFRCVDVDYLAAGIFLVSLRQGHPDLENTKDIIWDLLLEQFDGEVEEDSEIEVSIVYQ